MLILFFGRNSISLYDERSGLIGAAEIGKEIYNHLEISDHNTFHQFIGKFLVAHKVAKQKISIVLTEEISFTREESLKKEDVIPLRNSIDIYKTKDNLVYSFNAEILNCLVHNLTELRYQVFGIFPAQLFNLSSQDTLLENDVKEIVRSVKRLNKENLLLVSSRNSARRVELLLLGNLVFMLVLLGFVVRNTRLVNDMQSKSVRPTLESSTEIKTNETSEEIVQVNSEPTLAEQKISLRIQVLNGSGKTGLASKAQKILETAGFKVLEIGNTTPLTDTLIETKIELSPETISEIEKVLAIENVTVNALEESYVDSSTEIDLKSPNITIKLGKSFQAK